MSRECRPVPKPLHAPYVLASGSFVPLSLSCLPLALSLLTDGLVQTKSKFRSKVPNAECRSLTRRWHLSSPLSSLLFPSFDYTDLRPRTDTNLPSRLLLEWHLCLLAGPARLFSTTPERVVPSLPLGRKRRQKHLPHRAEGTTPQEKAAFAPHERVTPPPPPPQLSFHLSFTFRTASLAPDHAACSYPAAYKYGQVTLPRPRPPRQRATQPWTTPSGPFPQPQTSTFLLATTQTTASTNSCRRRL
ncbi:hypothetical protein B0H63DRAFT_16499 [Podospora didyma]|uniref:Uncharacterized protein n=1 Tax=Podospora didyma TaxID=330526 RepID=A0AAE0U7K3_9PEZI|nr:hypothetical protein B0H63DRAFT_16499 [Podospora didyma]